MTFVAAAGVASVDVIWTQDEQTVENTFHYHRTAAWDLASLEGLANTYLAWVSTRTSMFADVCQLVKVYARDLTTASSASVEVVPPAMIEGANASGQMPMNVTWALKRLTGLAGRANRGRLYMIGLSENQIGSDRQTILPSQATNFRVQYDALLSAQLADNTAQEVILHRALGTHTDVTEYGWSDYFLDSQRRRLPGHNRHR